MIFKELRIEGKVFKFSAKTNLIYSSKNSKGKTSLVRLILYSLGYPVPSTKGFDFSKLDIEAKIVVKNKSITITRKNKIIQISNEGKNKLVFKLPEEQIEVISIINDISNPELSESILGITYFDQDKGWTLLNRGIVIGKYRFNIERLVDSLATLNLKSIQDDLLKEKNKRKSYLQIKQLLELQEEREKNIQNIDWSNIDELQDQLRTVNMRFNQKKEQIKNFEVIARDNKKFSDLLEKMNIVIQIGEQQEILTSKNIVDYEFNKNVVLAQIARQKNDLQKITVKKNQLEKELNEHLQLINVDDQIERFNQQVSKIEISSNTLDSKLKQSKKEIDRLQELIKRNLKHTDQVQKIYTTLKKFTAILGVEDSLNNENDFIFTSNLKVFSGAKLHLLVFGFRLALLHVVQEQLNETYPIIIDSPMSGEVDEKNVNRMFDLLDKEFPNNQIILASIYDFNQKWDNKIILHNGVMNI